MVEDDEDWFEQALEESSADDEREPVADADAEADEDEPDADADAEGGGREPEAEADADEDERETPSPSDASETADQQEKGSSGTAPAESDGDEPSQADPSTAEPPEEAASPSGGSLPDSDAEAGADPFDAGDDEALDIDLEGGESFGFDVDSGSEPEFEEETYHADIPRISLGIDGLDAMIQEGLPERSLISIIGGAGTGKTTFALQFLQGGLEQGGRGVFITLEESRERIYQSARQKGWDFEGAAEAGNLAVLDLDPVDMANSLTSIRSELPRLVENFGADRLVLDSVSLLEMMYDDQATRRTEIYDFARALKSAGVTTMVTSEAAENTPYASRFGIIEYLTDAVFVLRYVRPEDFQETRLAVEIQKIRDANHSRETKPYEITTQGLSVYRDATIF